MLQSYCVVEYTFLGLSCVWVDSIYFCEGALRTVTCGYLYISKVKVNKVISYTEVCLYIYKVKANKVISYTEVCIYI